MTTMLTIDNLSIGYDTVCLLKDVSFSLVTGQKILLTGPSGCGKTSLLRCILGFTLPHDGNILFDGHTIDDRRIRTLRTETGYLPQQIEIGDKTVRQFLEQPFSYHANRDLAYDPNEVIALFKRFNLSLTLLDTAGSELSGGQKQRIGFVSILLLKRKLLLLDEPVSSLDPDNRKMVFQWLRENSDRTVLMIAHDREMESIADQCIDLTPYITGDLK